MASKLCELVFKILVISLIVEYRWVAAALKSQCIDGERDALLRFKQGFTSPSNHFSTWRADQDCCKWVGVGCNNRTGHVIALDLHNPDSSDVLQGELTASLLDLPYLGYLDLSFNDFRQMRIPEFIGSLHHLKHLNLSNSNFKGSIPDQLGNLSSLQSLDLSGNSFSLKANNLNWVSGLSSLEILDLGGVDLSSAVNWVDEVNMLPSLVEMRLFSCTLPNLQQHLHVINFTSLKALDLSFNNFYSSAIPNWLVETSRTLQYLNLSSCRLNSSIHDAFVNFTFLMVLDLSYNYLTGSIPYHFGNFTYLTVLDLSFNALQGPIPTTLGTTHVKNSSLRELRLSNNMLTGSIERLLPNLSQLVVLEVGSNSMEGVISEAHLQNFHSLRVLDLSANQIILNVSSNWLPPFQLQAVHLRSCQMGPRFPMWLQNQTKVLIMDICNAGIYGSVPDWFWDLSPSWEILNLSWNHLTGTLPDLLSSASLLMLDLSYNSFSGPLPYFPLKLEALLLGGNTISGPISPICENSRLRHVDLSLNMLSGGLPYCWTYGQNMAVLNVGYNQLSGQIPESIGHLLHLKELILSYNNFSGELPDSLKNCNRLFYLTLSGNAFSGTIPAWLGESLENLKILLLSRNMFEGNIPLRLCQLKYIISLDLSRNSLSGTIPRCITNFLVIADKEADRYSRNYDYIFYAGNEGKNRMWRNSKTSQEFGKVIDLSSNCLTGQIPREVTDLKLLQYLNLSNNQLTGPIPSGIGDMKMLESLDLSRNQLSCTIPPTMSNLSFLEVLDLSHNNLSGKIPSGGQFRTFDAESFLKNSNLCGPPLTKNCSEDASYEDPKCTEAEHNNKSMEAVPGHEFEISLVLGFIAGFGGFCAPLLIKTSWRHAYFRFLGSMMDRIYVWVVVSMARLQRGSFRVNS